MIWLINSVESGVKLQFALGQKYLLQLMNPILLALIFTLICAAPSNSAGRVALVYGNGAYQNAPRLANPVNDAALITSSLKQVGFSVITVSDGDQSAMQKGLVDFGRAAQNADVALFYFAGHGLQVGGRNWLIPVDADIESSTDLPARAISANTVLELMELSGAKARIAILDACRNNPLSRSLTRATSRGLAKIDSSAAGSMIIFATAPGQVALDGAGANSPFSKALAKQILVPGLEVRQMIGHVRRDVMADTGDKQVPWVNEAIVGDIYLASAPVEKPDDNGSSNPTTVTTDKSSSSTALEIAFWDSVKDSGDVDMLNLYANKFPQGVFIDIAKVRIAKLRSPPLVKPVPPVRLGNSGDQQASLSSDRSIARRQEMEGAARKFVGDLQRFASAESNSYLSGIPNYYSDQVTFYGKEFDISQIQKDKRSFVKRWPSRRYTMRLEDLDVFCSLESNRCDVEGIIDWEVQNLQKNKYISGVSRMTYEIEFFRTGPLIVKEDGSVLQRN